jgi:hypothetical protein
MWNTCKRIAAKKGLSAAEKPEKAEIFAGTTTRAYRLKLTPSSKYSDDTDCSIQIFDVCGAAAALLDTTFLYRPFLLWT